MKAGTAKRGPRVKRSDSIHTEEKILDTAEEMFALHGFHGVTMREVARSAGFDASLLSYYFQNKHGLFEAVFNRRAGVLNQERMEALDAYEKSAGTAMTVEGCIDAFIRPVFWWSMRGGPGWKHYFALVAQVNNTAVWGGETMGRYFDPVVHRLIGLIRKTLPGAQDSDLYWSYHMMTGALTLSLSETGRIDRLSGGLCRSGDLEAIFQKFVPYAAAGFRSAVKSSGPPPLVPASVEPSPRRPC